MAKKPAIQMTNGIDDIIKAGAKTISKAIKKNSPRIVYGNVNRVVRTKVLPESFSKDKAYIGKRFDIGGKNYNPNAFRNTTSLTKKEFNQTAAYQEMTKKAAKARIKKK